MTREPKKSTEKYKNVLIKEGDTVFVDEWKHEKQEIELRIQENKKFFKGEVAIEIGGPSEMFSKSGLFPIYGLLDGIDNYNFNKDTYWFGNIPGGSRIIFDDGSTKHYYQHIGEGTKLPVKSKTYKVALSSHTLEHIANPLKALFEWRRVLKPRGVLLLIMPHKGATPDHLRPDTEKEHFLEDYTNDTDEDDLTHLDEILELHDLSRDPWLLLWTHLRYVL